ncbi:MAG: carboxymuconolactone decarboxylase family protein [Parachlamydiaceae bacterium]
MSRVKPVTVEEAKGEVKDIYHSLEKNMGRVFNIFLNMGHSPAVLKGFLAFSDAANHTHLPPKIREQIALVVGQANQCQYCLSAHSAIAKARGMSEDEILKSRHAETTNIKEQAILKFAKQVVDNRGNVSNQEIAALKAAGVEDAEFVEIVFVILLNMFTNYFNHITDPVIDFPLAPEIS